MASAGFVCRKFRLAGVADTVGIAVGLIGIGAADTVIHYDPWWNPAVEDQATGRAHRIGQADQVFSWRLITAGSVEERVMQLQQNKRQLIEGLFARGNTTTVDTRALEALFAPLDDQP